MRLPTTITLTRAEMLGIMARRFDYVPLAERRARLRAKIAEMRRERAEREACHAGRSKERGSHV